MIGKAEQEFLDLLSSLTYSLGLGEATGKIWGVLALTGRPLTQAEIARLTGYSVPIVSVTISILEGWGFVTRRGKRGRSRLYVASCTLLDVLENFLTTLLERRLTPLAKFLRENLGAFKPEYRENAARLLKEYEKVKAALRDIIRDLRRIRGETAADAVVSL